MVRYQIPFILIPFFFSTSQSPSIDTLIPWEAHSSVFCSVPVTFLLAICFCREQLVVIACDSGAIPSYHPAVGVPCPQEPPHTGGVADWLVPSDYGHDHQQVLNKTLKRGRNLLSNRCYEVHPTVILRSH
jgi:hypothetical protein